MSKVWKLEMRVLWGERNGSGQAHFAVKVPVRKEGGISAQLLILYSASIVKRINPILYSLNYII